MNHETVNRTRVDPSIFMTLMIVAVGFATRLCEHFAVEWIFTPWNETSGATRVHEGFVVSTLSGNTAQVSVPSAVQEWTPRVRERVDGCAHDGVLVPVSYVSLEHTRGKPPKHRSNGVRVEAVGSRLQCGGYSQTVRRHTACFELQPLQTFGHVQTGDDVGSRHGERWATDTVFGKQRVRCVVGATAPTCCTQR